MANPEHVEIVKQGAGVLNQWRDENPNVILDLSFANLIYANLIRANLRNANLYSANLHFANLNFANFSNANLSNANLNATQAIHATFGQATLTGACVGDWKISSQTNLEGVVCDHIFLGDGHSTRHPRSGSFAPGDFAKLAQKSINTVELIFCDGIDWEAFVDSFQMLQAHTESDEVDIQAIENKGDGNVVIRVNSPPGADKAKIQEFVMKEYGIVLRAIEAKYRTQLRAENEQITQYRQESANLWSMAKLMADRSLNVAAKAATDINNH